MEKQQRLIDADALLGNVQFRLPNDNKNAEIIYGCVKITRRLIENAPTIDAEPVRHGRWEELQEKRIFGKRFLRCSNCNSENGIMIRFNYCFNCGAKMDGGAEDA